MSRVALLQTDIARPDRYRASARKARELAEFAASEDARKVLLNDAQLWDRMAEYEAAEPNHIKDSWTAKIQPLMRLKVSGWR
jgi:hypothetical protein